MTVLRVIGIRHECPWSPQNRQRSQNGDSMPQSNRDHFPRWIDTDRIESTCDDEETREPNGAEWTPEPIAIRIHSGHVLPSSREQPNKLLLTNSLSYVEPADQDHADATNATKVIGGLAGSTNLGPTKWLKH